MQYLNGLIRNFSPENTTEETSSDEYKMPSEEIPAASSSLFMTELTPPHNNHVIEIHNNEPVHLQNINSINGLIHYTDNHFINKLNLDMEKIRNLQSSRKRATILDEMEDIEDEYYESNSPITMSNPNSDSEGDEVEDGDRLRDRYEDVDQRPMGGELREYLDMPEYEMDLELIQPQVSPTKKMGYKKLSFHEVERTFDKYYEKEDKFSNEMDIIITYLKGQKNVYIQSKYIIQQKLNALMVPSFVLTATISILAPFIQSYSWSGGFISGINALIAMLITVIQYFKFESSIGVYSYLANQYDKMESSLEMTSSKMLFLESNKEKANLILTKMKEVEKKINDMKESSAVVFVPQETKILFPIICHINIFSFIKRVEVFKKNLMLKFKDIKNEIRYITFQNKNKGFLDDERTDTERMRERKRMGFLIKVKEKIKEELMHYKNAYGYIDELFTREIKRVETQKMSWSIWICGFGCNKPYRYKKTPFSNPVIDEYLDFIFADD